MAKTVNTNYDENYLIETREKLGRCVVHALVNQKGGCGKTTIASDLCYVLAERGFKVLAMDLDSQASLTQLLNVYPSVFKIEDEPVYGVHDLLTYCIDCMDQGEEMQWEDIKEAIITPTFKEFKRVRNDDGKFAIIPTKTNYKFDLIPSDTVLANFEQKLPQRRNGGDYLRQIVEIIKKNGGYDFIIIDAPPALTTLAYSSINAAESILSPVNLEVMTLRGTVNIASATAIIQKSLYERTGIIHKGILGLVKSKYVKSYKIQRELEDVIKEFSPIKAFDTTIPSLAACDKAHADRKLFSQCNKQAFEAFNNLVDEIIEEDIRRGNEKELVIVDNIGEEVERRLYEEN